MDSRAYFNAFWGFVENSPNAYDCWQEDGFWPERASSDLEHLLVWGTQLGLSYFSNGGIVAYLQFSAGRTFPEMQRGFAILGCLSASEVCQRGLTRLGSRFPRNDEARFKLVESDEEFFESLGVELENAMDVDRYESLVAEYCEDVCLKYQVPPWKPGE